MRRKNKYRKKEVKSINAFEYLKEREWTMPLHLEIKTKRIRNKKGVLDIIVNLFNIILKVLDGAIK